MTEETNPFKEMEEEHKAPEGLRNKVMTSVEISQLLMDMADLFTDKMGRSVLGLFKTKQDDED
uniref:Uncharacterized protein n=1 Tax=Roseihalotalea indica TaxID=2867963 RepID=A0AA49GUK8_9BACT|nr:hypothetical protein K4G66_08745 [Tunicatimonas sp. TK19036]